MKRMSNALAIALTIAGLSACNSNSNQKQEIVHSPKNQEHNLEDFVGTYEYQEKRDTIRLALAVEKDSLVGDLTYSLFEKDKNVGTFKGVIKDSLIVGEYRFMSEGMESTWEKVFGIVPSGLIEGFGDIIDENGKVKFVDKNNLRFDHGMLLKKKE